MDKCLVKILFILLLVSRTSGVNINEFFDYVLRRVCMYLQKNHYDPYHVDANYAMNISVGFVHARLSLFAGEVHNLSTLHRTGDTKLVANYSSLTMDVHGVVTIDHLQVIYSYAIQSAGTGPRGHILGNIIDVKAPFVLTIFPAYFEMKLQQFELSGPGEVVLEVTGFGPFDSWATGIANKFMMFYEQVLIKKFENILRQEANLAVGSVNPTELVGWGVLSPPDEQWD